MSEILVPIGGGRVAARVQPALHPHGTVVFVHGSGVDRHDPRNQFVANKLRRAGFDTVLLDLLKELAVVPTPSHFFREPEAIEAVAQHALRWFSRYLVKAARDDEGSRFAAMGSIG